MIYMIGDSTMKQNNYYAYPQTGWGQVLYLFTKPDILVFDHAENGRSTKSFIAEGRFDKVLRELKKGDYVICQFGHNDEKAYDPNRYTIPYETYYDNLQYFADEVNKKECHIVFATSITRHQFENGKCVNSHKDYPKAMLDFCKDYGYTCIDLNKITMDLYTKLGEQKSSKFHMIFDKNIYSNYKEGKDDHSHLTYEGAVNIAYLFVEALAKTNDPLNECFIDLNEVPEIDYHLLKD